MCDFGCFCVFDFNSLVRYLHPTDEELKGLIGKNAGTKNKGKGRKAATADSRCVNGSSYFFSETLVKLQCALMRTH